MPARNVSLTAHLTAFLDRSVEEGRFSNVSEVVRAGLRLLEQRQAEDDLKIEALRAAIDVGLEDARQGRVTRVEPGEELRFINHLGGGEREG